MQPILLEKRERSPPYSGSIICGVWMFSARAVREDFDPERSDFDFLVVFLAAPHSFDEYIGLEEALTRLLGRKVDLIMEGAIKNPYILETIRENQKLVYAA